MISRRAFALTLAAAGLALAPVTGRAKPKPRRLLRDLPYVPIEQIPNHRQMMRDIVIALSDYGRKRNPKFVTLVRNGPELLIKEAREYDWETARDPDGTGKYAPAGTLNQPYLDAIDGMLIDGLFYGHDAVDQPTDPADAAPLLAAAQALRSHGRRVLTVEYCRHDKVRADAERQARALKALTFIDGEADRRLAHLPSGRPPAENAGQVEDLAAAKNFLPMLHSAYGSRAAWVSALAATNYDLLVLDPFWRGSEPLTAEDVRTLRYKTLGSRRLLLARVPMGLADTDRYYWKPEWHPGDPAWVVAPDQAAATRMVIQYWDPQWKDIIGRYTQAVADLGFDGVLLDAADAYGYFEDRMPLD